MAPRLRPLLTPPNDGTQKDNKLNLRVALKKGAGQQLHALAYNLATFLRCIKLPEAMADWSLTSLQLKLITIGARVVRHARAITFQLAEVAVTGPMVRAILAAIRRLRAPPLCA
jgi:hypothetical protein